MFEIIILGALIIWQVKSLCDEVRYYRGTKKSDLELKDDEKGLLGCIAILLCALIPILFIVVLAVGAHRIDNDYLLFLLIASMIYEIISIPHGISFNGKLFKSDNPNSEYLKEIRDKKNVAFESFNVVETGTMIWLFVELVSQVMH